MSNPCEKYLAPLPELRREQAELAKLESAEIAGRAGTGPSIVGSGKGQRIKTITEPAREIAAKISKLEEEYHKCRIAHGGKPDLTEKAKDAKISIVLNGGSPIEQGLSFGVTFNHYEYKTWEIDIDADQPVLTFTYQGTDVDVLLTSESGGFNPADGQITLSANITLKIHHGGIGTPTIDLTLSSSHAGGSPMSKSGAHTAVLTGSGTIHESGGLTNPLAGSEVDLTLSFSVATYPAYP